MRQQSVSQRRQRALVAHHELLGRHFHHRLAVGVPNHEIDWQPQEIVLRRGDMRNRLLTRKMEIVSLIKYEIVLHSHDPKKKTKKNRNAEKLNERRRNCNRKIAAICAPPVVVVNSNCEECNQAVYALFGSAAIE